MPYDLNEMFLYLDELHDNKVVPMAEAYKWLQGQYKLSGDHARRIVSQWETTFDERFKNDTSR